MHKNCLQSDPVYAQTLVVPNVVSIPDFPVRYRLRLAMELANLQTEDLATKLDVHVNTVCNWLSGRTPPRRVTLMAIANVTGVALWWLEGREPTDADILNAAS